MGGFSGHEEESGVSRFLHPQVRPVSGSAAPRPSIAVVRRPSFPAVPFQFPRAAKALRAERRFHSAQRASQLLSGSVSGLRRPRDPGAAFRQCDVPNGRDPSIKRCRGMRPTQLPNDHASARLPPRPRRAASEFSVVSPLSSCRRLQPGARRHQAAGRVSPERDQQLAGDRDDAPLPRPSVAGCAVLAEPSRDLAVRLPAHPAPRHLDQVTCRQPDYAAFAAWGVVFMGFPAGNVGIITATSGSSAGRRPA